MNCWITTHWPPRDKRPPEMGAWVRDDKKDVLRDMRPGDLIFIYQTKSGKTTVEETADGTQTQVRRLQGKEGVIALARITTAAIDRGREGYEFYSDGSKTWWRYKAEAEVINSNGFIERRSLAKILGYKRRVDEVRTILVARSVASSVQERCRIYGIQVMEIPTWPSDSVPK